MGEIPRTEVLDNRTADYVLNAVRVAVGPFPIVGPLISELAGVVVPNQRVDRIAKFVAELECRVRELESPAQIKQQLSDESFTDLLEEGFRQAARSLSDDRRRYVASLICSSLSDESVRYVESRHLLRILDQINDIEIIWLRYYREQTTGADAGFRQKHAEILQPSSTALDSPQEEVDKETLQESYKEHLSQLNLLQHTYEVDMRTEKPEFDSWSGKQKVQGYEITALGRLLLREIGLGTSA